ncbi:MAG TPA: glycosyltransferase [Thermoleophilaceae bacterium]
MTTRETGDAMSEGKSRADLHCHSTASQLAKLGVQRAVGLPECATRPEEVYELAKRRGMHFVTITDHDTIAGAITLADRSDFFVSEELTARFKDEPQAVHVLCWGITPDDHHVLQELSGDVERCAEYLHSNEIACALAHPFYAVEAPLAPRHRRRLAELFPIWETRNGSRARELNQPAAVYIETRGGTGVGGSDDHAGVDIGRTYTETPHADTVEGFLEQIRAGSAKGCGEQGSAAKWAHSALAIALRVLGVGDGDGIDPRAVLMLAERVVRQGQERSSDHRVDLDPDDARRLLRAWLASVELGVDAQGLLELMQSDGFSHADLYRRARRCHERKLERAVNGAVRAITGGESLAPAAAALLEACTAAIPYVPPTVYLASEKSKLVERSGEPTRVALFADAVGGMHGVTHTLDELRERGVPGFEVEVIGTDAHVDRRLPAAVELDVPFYPGLKVGVPSLPDVAEAVAEGRYELVHLCSPGPAGVAGALVAHVMGLPVAGSYHTELAAYARVRTGDPALGEAMTATLGAFYGRCWVVMTPSESADWSVRSLGVPPERIRRWGRGVDLDRFSPQRRADGLLPGAVNVLYAGRLSREKGAELLADAFLAAAARDPRLHLVLAGGGPEEERLRERLGERGTLLGWLDGDDLARVYASADVFLFASRTDTFGQVVLEAQASGLPVVAVDEGGPSGLIEDRVSGRLCEPDVDVLAAAVLELAGSAALRTRFARAARDAAARHSWRHSLGQLAEGWMQALGLSPAAFEETRRAA